jgi:hypothetical protein
MTAFSPDLYVKVNGNTYQTEVDANTISITGGRISNGYQPEPMVATFDILPTDYYDFKLMESVEIEVVDPSTSSAVTIFYGYVQDINYNFFAYGNGVGQRRYTITAMDPTATLAFASFNASPTISQGNAGEQIGQALGYWDYASVVGLCWSTSPTLVPSINDQSTSSFVLDAINPAQTDIIGEFITETASQVNGCFYFNPIDQQIYFDGVTRRTGRSAYTLGFNEIKPDINLSQSVGMVLNSILVTRSGADSTATGTTSKTTFGKRRFQRDTRLHLSANATTKANNYLTSFSNVSSGSVIKRWRPSTISVDLHNPELTDAKRSSLINTFCGKRVNVTVPDPDTTSGTMTLNCFIEGWTWNFGVNQMSITAQLALTNDNLE